MSVKDDVIRVRVSTEQKELFKKIAKIKGVSMSEFMVVTTEERALREEQKFVGTELLEQRVEELDKKLNSIRGKMEKRKQEHKGFFSFLKAERSEGKPPPVGRTVIDGTSITE